jgi:hypothetical protein
MGLLMLRGTSSVTVGIAGFAAGREAGLNVSG